MEISTESPLELRLSKINGVQTKEQMRMLGLDKDYNRCISRNENSSNRQKWSRGKTSGKKSRTVAGYRRTFFLADMTVSRPCRHSLGVPVTFWTTVFLILLARGVYSNDEQSRFRRSPKFDQGNDFQGGFALPKTQEMMQFLRELLQRQRTGQHQVPVYNGEDARDNQIDWRKIPLPLLNQIRSIINDGTKEEDKRGSYMSLCHFKICNLG